MSDGKGEKGGIEKSLENVGLEEMVCEIGCYYDLEVKFENKEEKRVGVY